MLVCNVFVITRRFFIQRCGAGRVKARPLLVKDDDGAADKLTLA